jgi:hypothetical protein
LKCRNRPQAPATGQLDRLLLSGQTVVVKCFFEQTRYHPSS